MAIPSRKSFAITSTAREYHCKTRWDISISPLNGIFSELSILTTTQENVRLDVFIQISFREIIISSFLVLCICVRITARQICGYCCPFRFNGFSRCAGTLRMDDQNPRCTQWVLLKNCNPFGWTYKVPKTPCVWNSLSTIHSLFWARLRRRFCHAQNQMTIEVCVIYPKDSTPVSWWRETSTIAPQ